MRSAMSIGVSFLFFYVLPFYIKVDASCRTVLGDPLAVKCHLEFGDPRPLHPADGFCRFCHGVFCGLRKAFLGCAYDFDDFLRHGFLLAGRKYTPGEAEGYGGEQQKGSGGELPTLLCQAVNPWDEPCTVPATRRCD